MGKGWDFKGERTYGLGGLIPGARTGEAGSETARAVTPHVCNPFSGPGFETPSSPECLVMGERPLLCHSIGTAGTPRDRLGLSYPRPQSFHPWFQKQRHPLRMTRL